MSTPTQKQQVQALLESIETGAKEPISYINPTQYTQHNQAVGDGLAGFGEALSHLPEGSARVNMCVLQDGDYVIAHSDYDFFGPKIGFDVFRFEDGLIVEHWDNLQQTAGPNPSGRSMVDGPTQIVDLDKTQANKELVRGFVDAVLVRGDMSELPSFFGPTYHQHNPAIADGLDGLGAALQAMAEQGVTMKYDTVHAVFGEGNFVLTISEGEFGGAHTAFYDLFRVEDGKIVEHWDVIQTVLPDSEAQNANGKFGF